MWAHIMKIIGTSGCAYKAPEIQSEGDEDTHTADQPVITIHGENFTTDTRVYIGHLEVPVLWKNEQTLEVAANASSMLEIDEGCHHLTAANGESEDTFHGVVLILSITHS